MSKVKKESKSFSSVLIFLLTLFFLVVFNMEIRRKGYEFWNQLKQVQNLEDQNRLKRAEYTKRLNEKISKYLKDNESLKPPEPGQILHVRGKVIFKQ